MRGHPLVVLELICDRNANIIFYTWRRNNRKDVIQGEKKRQNEKKRDKNIRYCDNT